MRIGSQEPTASLVLPYKKTYGEQAAELYNASGRTCQEWQVRLLNSIMAVNDDGLWMHTKFGWSVPRRNGKSELLIMRLIWGLMNGERILYTAHRTTTSHAAFERVDDILNRSGFATKTFKQYGLERVESADGSFEGRCNFRTRSSKGGLGEEYSLVLYDEAQELTDDQYSALKYVGSACPNPQSLFCGTPPTAVSAGTVFTKFRESCLFGEARNSGWAEWSVESMTDCRNIDAWYATNPSLGLFISERSVGDEITSDDIDFNVQRLGLWLKYNQHSCISENDWCQLTADTMPQLNGKLFVGIKCAHDNTTIAMSIAVKTDDGRIFVESIDDRPVSAGYQWIIDFIRKAPVQMVVIDGANGQQAIAAEMKDNKLLKPYLPTVKDVIAASVDFEQGIAQKTICHSCQESLKRSATNVEKRAIGSNGGFGYKSLLADVDVSLLESVVLAYWACNRAKAKKKQAAKY